MADPNGPIRSIGRRSAGHADHAAVKSSHTGADAHLLGDSIHRGAGTEILRTQNAFRSLLDGTPGDFRGWTGVSPREFRKSLVGNGA